MRNRVNVRGNAFISLICGLLGVALGAVMVYYLMGSRATVGSANDVDHHPLPDAKKPVAQATATPAESANPDSAHKQAAQLGGESTPGGSPGNVAGAVARVEPAVVNIDTTALQAVPQQSPFGPLPFSSTIRELPKGMGTGVIVSKDGIVLTNNHVIANTKSVYVTLNDKRQFKAKVLGADAVSDLAVLKIEGQDFPTVELTSSQNMRTGDWVVALGNPLGVGQTATVGVLSARGRHIGDQSTELRDLLQTDAAINPGNSGGPLVNMSGQVIGINTAIIPYAQGIGFAIPAETAIKFVSDIQQYGRVIRPYLGIQMADLTPKARRFLELPETVQGVAVGGILEGSPADKGGLHTYDVITKLNDTPVTSCTDLQSILHSYKVGTSLKVSVIRDKEPLVLDIVLEEMPSENSVGQLTQR